MLIFLGKTQSNTILYISKFMLRRYHNRRTSCYTIHDLSLLPYASYHHLPITNSSIQLIIFSYKLKPHFIYSTSIQSITTIPTFPLLSLPISLLFIKLPLILLFHKHVTKKSNSSQQDLQWSCKTISMLLPLSK